MLETYAETAPQDVVHTGSRVLPGVSSSQSLHDHSTVNFEPMWVSVNGVFRLMTSEPLHQANYHISVYGRFLHIPLIPLSILQTLHKLLWPTSLCAS